MENPSSPLFNWLEALVPSRIRDNRDIPVQVRFRAPAMIATLMISILCPLVALMLMGGLQLFTKQDYSTGMMITLIVLVLTSVQHIYFQSFGNLKNTAAAYSTQYIISIIISMLYTGGSDSPIAILLFCSPLIAYMTISHVAALIHASLLVIFIVILSAAENSGYSPVNLIKPETKSSIQMISWALFCMVNILFILVCEYLIYKKQNAF